MLLVENLLMSGGGPTDPYFENVALLLHGDGTNGGQNNTFIDSSSNNFTITRNGNTTQGSFNPYGTLWSNYFDGTGDYLNAPNNAAFDLGSSNFTIEAWVFPLVYKSGGGADTGFAIISRYTSGLGLVLKIVNATTLRFVRGADVVLEATGLDIPLNSWSHVAVSRSSGNLSLFFNGTRVAAATGISNFTDASTTVQIGLTQTINDAATGYISNLRVVKGTAVYDPTLTTLTVPTGNLTAISNTSLLTCQSNRFIDNSTNNFAITRTGDTRVTSFAPFAPPTVYTSAVGGSAYIDGSGDTLVTPATAAFAYGTGDFTYETWVYPESTPNDSYIIAQPSAGAGFPLFTIYNGALHWVPSAGSYQAFALSVTNGQWNHIAAVRQSGTVYGFLNGVRGSTSHAYTTSLGSDRFIRLCEGNRYKGYLSDTRISNVAVYTTTTYTIPTSKVAATSSTNLLLNYTNAAIFDSAAKNDLETVGNAQIDTGTKKFGTGSLEFDGTGDYLILQPTPTLEPSAGNLTWEMWVNTSSSTQYATLYSRVPSSFGAGMWTLMINLASAASGDVGLYVGDYSISVPLLQTSVVNVRDANWHHIAVVRSSSSWVLYVDGTSRATNTWTGTITALASAQTRIGQDQLVGRDYLGYIDDLRITNGVARYTANFTPPTRPFPDK